MILNKYIFLTLIGLIKFQSFAQNLELIKSVQIDSSDYRFESSIEEYKTSEDWTLWSFYMVNVADSSVAPIKKTIDYYNQNINDKNLSTAWTDSKSELGIRKKIEFVFHYDKNQTFYGSAYQFFGQINLFNGYCSSIDAWQEYSRAKTIKIYYNDLPICLIELIDTWHFQYFTIEHYFRNKYSKKYLGALYEIIEGDRLSFEIIEVYNGTKYEDVALSEFMIQGASN